MCLIMPTAGSRVYAARLREDESKKLERVKDGKTFTQWVRERLYERRGYVLEVPMETIRDLEIMAYLDNKHTFKDLFLELHRAMDAEEIIYEDGKLKAYAENDNN